MDDSQQQAIALLPLVLLPLVMLAGAMQPLHEMNRAGRALAQAIPSRWTFESLLVLEAAERPLWTPPVPATQAGTPNTSEHPPQDMAEKHFPADSERMGARAGTLALAGMLVALIMLNNGILRMRDVHKPPAKPRQPDPTSDE